MSDIQKKYESETSEKALYRTNNGVDHHTLKYVRWLEAAIAENNKELAGLREKVRDLHDDILFNKIVSVKEIEDRIHSIVKPLFRAAVEKGEGG